MPRVRGCTNNDAANFYAAANSGDGSCVEVKPGCTDRGALNFDPDATRDNRKCIPIVRGCMNSVSYTFDYTANVDDGSCAPVMVLHEGGRAEGIALKLLSQPLSEVGLGLRLVHMIRGPSPPCPALDRPLYPPP